MSVDSVASTLVQKRWGRTTKILQKRAFWERVFTRRSMPLFWWLGWKINFNGITFRVLMAHEPLLLHSQCLWDTATYLGSAGGLSIGALLDLATDSQRKSNTRRVSDLMDEPPTTWGLTQKKRNNAKGPYLIGQRESITLKNIQYLKADVGWSTKLLKKLVIIGLMLLVLLYRTEDPRPSNGLQDELLIHLLLASDLCRFMVMDTKNIWSIATRFRVMETISFIVPSCLLIMHFIVA